HCCGSAPTPTRTNWPSRRWRGGSSTAACCWTARTERQLTEKGARVNDQHERRLAQVFVELADTLVDDFDVLDFLSMLVERCVELLDVAAAGVVLSDQKGGLRMAAASSEQARLVELFAVQADDGPCPDCV